MENKVELLCVDDETINLMIIKKILGKKYTVLTAENATLALDCLEKNPEIKVIISDMKMPGMDGLEFIQTSSKKFPDKKYFMLSGYSITEDIQNAIDHGLILKYFQKPANFSEIDDVIQKELNTMD